MPEQLQPVVYQFKVVLWRVEEPSLQRLVWFRKSDLASGLPPGVH
jgi:hypothetical protein